MDVSPSGSGLIEVGQYEITSFPDTIALPSGESVSLKAVPNPGYEFAGWDDNASVPTNPTTIVMDCNKEITANFTRVTHTLTILINGNGATMPAAGNHSYSEGITISITAVPESGWQFDNWTGDIAETESLTNVLTIDSDKTVTANFSQLKPTWWFISGIIAGILIIGAIAWSVVRSRRAP